MKLHFLQTKWSDMIILEENHKFAIVDTGFEEQYDQLAKYLDDLGAKTIEFILLTHFHRDHYGNIVNLVKNFDVKKVYFKEYGGHDVCTAWGSEADDEYRQSERNKWKMIKECVEENSQLVLVESIRTIDFEGTSLQLYSNENTVEKIWNDEKCPDTYHKNIFSENINSLAVFFDYKGKTVFLGGDIMDHAASHPLANYINLQIAKQIGKQIYLYKVPHHGTNDTTCDEALSIYKPEIAVITNAMEWLSKFETLEALKRMNPNVKIIITEDEDITVTL